MRKLLLTLCVIAGFSVPAFAQTVQAPAAAPAAVQMKVINLDGSLIRFPNIQGFVEISKMPQMRPYLAQMLDPNDSLLAAYVSLAQLQLIAQGRAKGLYEYILVDAQKAPEASAEDFLNVVHSLKNENVNETTPYGSSRGLGPMYETKDAYGSWVSSSTPGQPLSLMGINVMRLNNRVITVSISNISSPSAQEWIKQMSVYLVGEFMRLNPNHAMPPRASGFSRIPLQIRIVGIGFVLLLAAALFIRKKS